MEPPNEPTKKITCGVFFSNRITPTAKPSGIKRKNMAFAPGAVNDASSRSSVFFAVVFARHRRSSGRFSAAVGGLCGGFPPGGEVTREVTEVSWLSHACGCERRAHCEFNRHCQSAYAFLNLKARAPVRGWVLFGGQLGGRSETTSDSGRERFLSCLALGCVLRNSIFYFIVRRFRRNLL